MVSLEELERAHILQVLEAVGWHKKRAAEILEINPSTLYRKLLRYGVGQIRTRPGTRRGPPRRRSAGAGARTATRPSACWMPSSR